jgi:DNA polymerase V
MKDQTVVITEVLAAAATANIPPLALYATSPAAGFPAPGDDLVEKSLNVHDFLVSHPEATFFVRVEGDSMEGAGIFSGDILVVDRSVLPATGRIVVAAINGEMVVKRLHIQGNRSLLVSENSAYAPIAVGDGEDCFIWGVVTGSVRRF